MFKYQYQNIRLFPRKKVVNMANIITAGNRKEHEKSTLTRESPNNTVVQAFVPHAADVSMLWWKSSFQKCSVP